MPVSAQETLFQYVANSITVTFAYGCQVPQASDLHVYLDDVEVTTGFTVSGIGVTTGGAVTFDTPPADGAQVRLERVISLERTTDYQQNGDFLARVVNPDFNRLWMALQQHATMFRRALLTPKSDAADAGALPSAAQRANNLLGFDADGNPIAVAPAAQSATALQGLLAATTGPGLLGWIRAAAGAVATTLAKWMGWQRLSVFEFLTDAQIANVQSGTYDPTLTAALRAAIVAAAGRKLRAPAGTYILNATLNINWSSSSAAVYQPGTKIEGDGEGNTFFINRSGAAAMKHVVTVAQATAGCRFYGGELSGFSVSRDGTSPAGSKGIELYSYWFPHIHDIDVSGVDGNGIETPVDAALSGNPDRYSCGVLTLDRVTMSGNTGKGIYSGLWSNTWRVRDPYFTNNAGGAMDVAGSAHEVLGGAAAGNGTSASTCGGIHFNYAGGAGTPHNCVVRGVELDNNWGTHVWAEGYGHKIEQNRYIQDAAQGVGGNTFRNTTCVLLDATASGTAANNEVRGGLVRMDNAGAATLTAFKVVDAAGAENNAVIDMIFQGGGAGLTKYSFPAARKRNYAVENGVQVAGSGQHVYGRGQVAIVNAASSLLLTASPQVLPYSELYDDSNAFGGNAFTAPHAGVLNIEFNGVFRPITTANVAANIYVYKNGALYHTQPIPQGFPVVGSDTGYSFPLTMLVAKGDVIDIRASVATASTLYWISSGTATTKFQML